MVGVPNLASLHNRFLLLMGKQPTSIRPFGPHVRGFTYNGLKDFFEKDDYFTVEAVKGSNFYPFGESIAQPLSRCFPLSSVSIFLKIRRTDKPGCFIDVLRSNFFETNFYVGNGQTLFDW